MQKKKKRKRSIKKKDGGGAEEGHETKSWTHVELSGEACEARLTINRRKDVKSKLFWLFYDDVFSGWIPPNHVVIFWTLKEPVQSILDLARTEDERKRKEERGQEKSNEKTLLTRRVL